MSGDRVALLAFLGSAAVLGLIWLWGWRVDARSRERYEIMQSSMASRTAPEVGPLTPAGELAAISDALERVLGELETAKRLLDEVYSIGLWSKSDDCSDNRRKRQGMRETDWAVSGAQRALKELRPRLQEIPETIDALERDLTSLVAVIEPLPETISDIMGESPALDAAVSNISAEVTRLSERASQLAAGYDQRTPEQVQPP
jgi:chromosome segregation ATPase